ncbi:hypothetical protein PpBr36_02324 [Pyricularia pennisetigena]|uniref:hypothetical protein n=1 Tax=Pyricularia pennisetigena TaxID=1578925 RepID=UPI00114FDC57|nr:hypothetical protein PpBr36_02324 [Pyricularia pennisetigena]TLS30423.1 hypothetical protein PpBr36_02324 [Pyricularia pennisetigena]
MYAVWGQCGTTQDLCIDTTRDGQKNGTFACISNCSISLTRSPPPANFIKLGYFEGWDSQRHCLHMDATQIDPSHTHIHFTVGVIRDDFSIDYASRFSGYQFEQFRKLRGSKRNMPFGGWVFSVEVAQYQVLQNGVKTAENRQKLAGTLIQFVEDHGLDGLSIDWESPSAPNLGIGVPAGDKDESQNLSCAA